MHSLQSFFDIFLVINANIYDIKTNYLCLRGLTIFLILYFFNFIFHSSVYFYRKINTADSCILFDQKKNWYKSTKKSNEKWGVPISLQLAIINQESSFKQFAKPKEKDF